MVKYLIFSLIQFFKRHVKVHLTRIVLNILGWKIFCNKNECCQDAFNVWQYISLLTVFIPLKGEQILNKKSAYRWTFNKHNQSCVKVNHFTRFLMFCKWEVMSDFQCKMLYYMPESEFYNSMLDNVCLFLQFVSFNVFFLYHLQLYKFPWIVYDINLFVLFLLAVRFNFDLVVWPTHLFEFYTPDLVNSGIFWKVNRRPAWYWSYHLRIDDWSIETCD